MTTTACNITGLFVNSWQEPGAPVPSIADVNKNLLVTGAGVEPQPWTAGAEALFCAFDPDQVVANFITILLNHASSFDRMTWDPAMLFKQGVASEIYDRERMTARDPGLDPRRILDPDSSGKVIVHSPIIQVIMRIIAGMSTYDRRDILSNFRTRAKWVQSSVTPEPAMVLDKTAMWSVAGDTGLTKGGATPTQLDWGSLPWLSHPTNVALALLLSALDGHKFTVAELLGAGESDKWADPAVRHDPIKSARFNLKRYGRVAFDMPEWYLLQYTLLIWRWNRALVHATRDIYALRLRPVEAGVFADLVTTCDEYVDAYSHRIVQYLGNLSVLAISSAGAAPTVHHTWPYPAPADPEGTWDRNMSAIELADTTFDKWSITEARESVNPQASPVDLPVVCISYFSPFCKSRKCGYADRGSDVLLRRWSSSASALGPIKVVIGLPNICNGVNMTLDPMAALLGFQPTLAWHEQPLPPRSVDSCSLASWSRMRAADVSAGKPTYYRTVLPRRAVTRSDRALMYMLPSRAEMGESTFLALYDVSRVLKRLDFSITPSTRTILEEGHGLGLAYPSYPWALVSPCTSKTHDGFHKFWPGRDYGYDLPFTVPSGEVSAAQVVTWDRSLDARCSPLATDLMDRANFECHELETAAPGPIHVSNAPVFLKRMLVSPVWTGDLTGIFDNYVHEMQVSGMQFKSLTNFSDTAGLGQAIRHVIDSLTDEHTYVASTCPDFGELDAANIFEP